MNWLAWIHELHLVTGTIALRGAKLSKEELKTGIERLRKVEKEMKEELNVRKVILVDIDHTISNAFHRDHMIGGEWDAYHEASINDEPVHDIVNLLRSLATDYELLGITARPEKWRQLTFRWFIKHSIPIDAILMRPNDCYDPSPVLKMKLALQAYKALKEHIAFVLEDRDDVCAAFREAGVTVLQVHARRD